MTKRIHYIHITKTAGTTGRAVLKPCLSYKHKFFHTLSDDRHYYLSDLPEDMRDMFLIVSCVRNPWDRLVSLYYHSKNKKEKLIVPYDSFTDFCLALSSLKVAKHRMTQKGDEIPAGYNNQFRWLERNGKLDQKIGYLMRFERFNEDLFKVCEMVGIEVEIPHLNKSKHKYYTEYYDNRTRNIVKKLYNKDIKAFKYSFGG